MENGWIKLHRSIARHWTFQDAEIFRLWVDALLLASHKDDTWLFNGRLIEVKRGAFVVSKLAWAKRLKLSRQKIDRVLKMFEDDQMVVQRTFNKFTLLTVAKYDLYQVRDEPGRAAKIASESDSDGHQAGIERATNGQLTDN